MNNVDRVSTVVYGNDVAIAVKPRNTVTNETAMANEIRQAVVNEVGNRNVYVSVRNDMFTRVDAMSTRLRNGTVTNDFNRDIGNMFRDIRYGFNWYYAIAKQKRKDSPSSSFIVVL